MTRTALVASALAAFGGVLLGLFFGRLWSAEPTRTSTPSWPATPESGAPEFAESLRAISISLDQVLELLRRHSDRASGAQPPSSPRAAVPPASALPDEPETLELLRRIADAVQRGLPATAPSPHLAPPPINEEALAPLLGEGWETQRRVYELWTVADLVRHLGHPSQILEYDDRTHLVYELSAGGVSFRLRDGLIVGLSRSLRR